MNTVLVDKPNIEIYGRISYPVGFKWTRIVLFETLVSLIFTYGLMATYYLSNTGVLNPGHSAFISLNLFLCLVLAGQLTGAHTNPIITLCLLIGKGNFKINPVNAAIYMLSQFVGSFAGGAIALGVIQDFGVPRPVGQFSVGQIFGGEIVGTFLMCLWLLIVVNEKTTFIKSNFWNYILLPVIFYISREVTSQINGLNPASVLSNQVFYGIKYNDWVPIQNYWAYIVGPVIGSVIAALFFNYFYLPLLLRWKSKK